MSAPIASSIDPEFTRFAHLLADRAEAQTLARWIEGCASEDKNESGGAFDPVTDADREAERAMRELIGCRYPGHGISGEEFGTSEGVEPLTWSLDPVDGTRAFVCGLPTWVTLIALLDASRPVLGLVAAPALGERYWGWNGAAFAQRRGENRPIRTSGCTRLDEARLTTTDPTLFGEGRIEAFDALRRRARVVRYGLDGYGYARLAAGSIDLVAEAGLKPHDYNALIPLVRAAGGAIGGWEGGEEFAGGRVLAAATPQLFEEALGLLSRR